MNKGRPCYVIGQLRPAVNWDSKYFLESFKRSSCSSIQDWFEQRPFNHHPQTSSYISAFHNLSCFPHCALLSGKQPDRPLFQRGQLQSARSQYGRTLQKDLRMQFSVSLKHTRKTASHRRSTLVLAHTVSKPNFLLPETFDTT